LPFFFFVLFFVFSFTRFYMFGFLVWEFEITYPKKSISIFHAQKIPKN